MTGTQNGMLYDFRNFVQRFPSKARLVYCELCPSAVGAVTTNGPEDLLDWKMFAIRMAVMGHTACWPYGYGYIRDKGNCFSAPFSKLFRKKR